MGLEQNLRDARISTIYEGTTGIQALDLLGRKTLKNNGELLALFCTEVNNFCAQIPATQQANPTIKGMLATLAEYLKQWQQLTVDLGQRAASDADEVGAAAFDYLMYAGYIVSAYYWLQAALCAQQALDSGQGQQSNDFYRVKLATANFYFDKMLPRAKLHAAGITSGAASLMALSNETLLKSQL